jgi:tetratricopeptide (TPR) repeat protein
MRCLSEAETHFGPDHPHTVKTLRVFAMLHDRQQRFEDSCVLLQRALSGTVAHHGSRLHPEAQEVTDELVKQLLQCGRPHDALQVGQEHFDAVSSSGAASDAGLADSLVTLATVLGKSGRPDQAEQHARRALELREKTFGELAPQTAVALTVLAGILEDQGKLGPETEGLLIRASTAFQRSEGSRGSAAMVMNQLQRVRGRREEGVGGGLMRRAGECFEAKDFRQAEELLAQALDIFKAEGGEQHPSTQAASQNLGIARQNALLQLWRQVAAEEAERVRAEAEADAQAGKSQRVS